MNYTTLAASKQEATERAEELAAHLNKAFNTTKWKIHVHENLGWYYYYARCGTISVSANENTGTYYTLISDDKEHAGTGAMIWHIQNDHALPERSVRRAVQAMIDKAQEINYIVNENLSLLNLKPVR